MPTRISSGWGSVWCCVLGSTAQYTGCISSARGGVLAGLWIFGGTWIHHAQGVPSCGLGSCISFPTPTSLCFSQGAEVHAGVAAEHL